MTGPSPAALRPLALIGLAALSHAQGDDCSTPTVALLGVNSYDTTGFTSSGFDGGGTPCFTAPAELAGPHDDGFFLFTVPASADYAIDTIGTGSDTVLQVHSGADCSATCFAYDDDGGSFSPTFGESRVLLQGLAAGDSYLLQLGTWGGVSGGTGVLNVATYTPPVNDTCASPTALGALVGSISWDNTFASTSGFDGGGGGGVCGGGGSSAAVSKDLFFTWDCPASGNYTFSSAGSVMAGDQGETISVHLGSDCSATCINAFAGPSPASVIVTAAAGTTYLVQAGGWLDNYGAAGALSIGLTPPPTNDDCDAPTPVFLGSTAFDLDTATTSVFEGGGAPCPASGSGLEPFKDLFYVWNAPLNGDFVIDTYGVDIDTIVNLHLGSDCSASCVFSSDWGNADSQSRIELVGVSSGTSYLLQVGVWEQETLTAGVLNIGLLPAGPVNDTCATPTALPAGVQTVAFDNTTARASRFDGGGAPCLGPNNPVATQEIPTRDLFWVWQPAFAGDYQLDTIGSGIDTILSVHLGGDCAATCLAGDDNSAGSQESLLALTAAQIGQDYLVQVGSWVHETTSTGVLNISLLPVVPANDTCAAPQVLSGEGTFPWSNLHPLLTTSGFDGGDPVACMSPVNPDNTASGQIHYDLFYVWTADCAQDYVVSTDGSPVVTDTRLSVHLGGDCGATCLVSNDDIDLAGGNWLSEVTLTGVVPGTQYLIQLGTWSDGTTRGEGVLSITGLSAPCPQQGIQITCDPALDHFLGDYVKLDTSTVGAATPTGAHLDATGGPPSKFGFVLVAGGASLSIPVFQGVLCLDAPAGRYTNNVATNQGLPQLNSIGQFDAAGVLQNLVGSAPSTGGVGFDVPVELPFSPAGQVIAPGDTYSFQVWYRDEGPGGVPSANFSNVATITF